MYRHCSPSAPFPRCGLGGTIALVALLAVLSSVTPGCGQNTTDEIPLGFRVLGTRIPPEAENIPITDGWAEVAPKTNLALPKLTAGDKRRGYVVFSKHYLESIYPTTRPLAAEITDRVEMFSAPGEYEPVTLAVHALRDIHGAQLVAGDLRGPRGSRIAASNIDIRTVRCMPVFAGPGKYTIRPTLLEKRPGIDIGRNTTAQFWITVWVPADSRAGQYSGKIRILGEGLRERSVPLQMEVLPVRLTTPPTLHGMYYNPVKFESAPDFVLLPLDEIRKDILNMKEHGMRTLFVSIPPVCEAAMVDGEIRYDLEPLRPFVKICRDAGFRGVIYNTSIREIVQVPLGGYTTMLAAYVDGFRRRGWPLPVCSVGDESDANNSLPEVLPMMAALRKDMPDVTIFTTVVFPENSEVHEPHIDIRAFSSYIDETVVEKTRKAGRQLWQYSGTAAYGQDPRGDRMYRGLWTAKLGLLGVLQWTYWRPVLDTNKPFNDLVGGRNNMTCWVFPGKDGPLPSLGWEAMREGTEDEKYYHTLTALIQQAGEAKNEDLRALAKDAERYLQQVCAQVDSSPRPDNKVFPIRRAADKLAPQFFDDFRRKAATYITKIEAKLASRKGAR